MMGARIDRGQAALAAALALALAAAAPGCGSDDGGTAPEATYTVLAPGDRHEIVIGLAPAGTFRFEARGFSAAAAASPCDTLPVFFYLYDGVPDAAATLFRYELIQGRLAGACTGIAVRGFRPEYPGNLFQEGCAPFDWNPMRWYEFEVAWDRGLIRTFVDGALVFEGDYFGNEAPLIAALGWPPVTACGSTGVLGIEYRRWELERP